MLEKMEDRIIKTLDEGPQIELSLESCKRFLSRHIDKKLKLVVLIADIVGSTQLSLTHPTKMLARIIQLFSQEMKLIADKYGGYVLKYVGDASIILFPAEFDSKNACINAIACANDMQNVIEKHINSQLEKRSYPTIHAKFSINIGSDLVVLYGKSMSSHIDIVGSAISIASKIIMTSPPGSIIITQYVYDELDEKSKCLFREIRLNNVILDTIKSYQLVNDDLQSYVDGKVIVYKTIDELEIESLLKENHVFAIKEILKHCIKEGFKPEVYRNITIALIHFVLSKYMIPSERNINVNNIKLDIVIPSLRVLHDNPKHAIILSFPDQDTNLDELSRLQPNKDNIWLIFGYAKEKYPDYKVYLPDQFVTNNLKSLSSIIDDINNFLKNVRRFNILPI